MPVAQGLTAIRTPGLAGAKGAGRRGFTAPDGTKIVVQLDRHDTGVDGQGNHIGIGATVWEVDAAGNIVGDPIPRWVLTVPIDVVAAGGMTLSDIGSSLETDAIAKILGRKKVKAAFSALDLALPPSVVPDVVITGPETLPAAPSSIS